MPDQWYVACRSEELARKPRAVTVHGTPLVLFRDAEGEPGALLDRCVHRNAPLSEGRVLPSGQLECRYHGWRFDVEGRCRHVPCLIEGEGSEPGEGGAGIPAAEGRSVEACAVLERDGFVWVYADPGEEPEGEPFPLPLLDAPGYTTVVRRFDVEGTLHATAENILDVPHTAYLHRGLFRGGEPETRITAEVRRWPDRVEAEYMGESRPPGLAARLLSPSGGAVQHWDRFILPSVAQVEYRMGPENHFLVTNLLTPVSDFATRIFAVITFRVRVPGWILRPLLTPVAVRIFRQDAEMLELQSETIRRFGGERFTSTDVDVLGREIWALLRRAERGHAPSPGPKPGAGGEPERVRRIELLV